MYWNIISICILNIEIYWSVWIDLKPFEKEKEKVKNLNEVWDI